jgi:large subunit ribosomal protein L21
MYAIIEESGGQRWVREGEEILVDLMKEGAAKSGEAVSFDKVLAVGKVGQARFGTPYVSGASVRGEVVDPLVKGEKIDVWKFREKKTWQRKQGHRQKYTRVKVTAIQG